MKAKNALWLKTNIEKIGLNTASYGEIITFTNKLYEKGYSGLDLIYYIEQNENIESMRKSQLLITFNKVKRDFINEKLFILFIITFIRSDDDLENISFM
jgi:hypothetical protein